MLLHPTRNTLPEEIRRKSVGLLASGSPPRSTRRAGEAGTLEREGSKFYRAAFAVRRGSHSGYRVG